MEPKKDLTIKDETISDTRKMAIFQNDSDFFVVHKKAERLVTATYMITNFFVPEEPLKWSLRKVSTKFLKDTVALSSASLSSKESLVRTLASHIVELASLYSVAVRAGFISQTNFQIIKSELEKILDLLETREGTQVGTQNISFDETFFKVEAPKRPDITEHIKTPIWGQTGTNFGAHTEHSIGHQKLENFSQASHLREAKPFSHTAPELRKPVSFIKDNQKDIKDRRQDTILSLIKKKKRVTIKEFQGVIKGCSEKTIQRELLTLVARGVLKKEGERRWSTYSLYV